MKTYSCYDLGMNVSGEKFILPFDVDEKDETIIEKTIESFSEVYERQLFTDRVKDDKISQNKWDKDKMDVKCMYEGNCEYYPFTFVIEFFRINYKKNEKPYYYSDTHTEVKDGQVMISIMIEQEEGDLLEELIEYRTMPGLVEKLKLKKYTFWAKKF